MLTPLWSSSLILPTWEPAAVADDSAGMAPLAADPIPAAFSLPLLTTPRLWAGLDVAEPIANDLAPATALTETTVAEQSLAPEDLTLLVPVGVSASPVTSCISFGVQPDEPALDTSQLEQPVHPDGHTLVWFPTLIEPQLQPSQPALTTPANQPTVSDKSAVEPSMTTSGLDSSGQPPINTAGNQRPHLESTQQTTPGTTVAIVETGATTPVSTPTNRVTAPTGEAVVADPSVESGRMPTLTPDFEQRVPERGRYRSPARAEGADSATPPVAPKRPAVAPATSADATVESSRSTADESAVATGDLPPAVAPIGFTDVIPSAEISGIRTLAAGGRPAMLSKAQEVTRQLIEATLARMEVVRRDGPSDVAVRLSPPHLGVLHVALQQTDQGWSVQVWAENPGTRQLLTEARQEIVSGLKQQQPGVNLSFDSRGERGRPDPQELEVHPIREFGRWTFAASATNAAPARQPRLSIWA